jgi:HK97 family phage prohead protease
MEINFSATEINLTANTSKREISGLIVPFNSAGYTSAGEVVFEKGAFGNITASKIKLLRDHDIAQPVGRMIQVNETAQGLEATFKLGSSTRAQDTLLEASEGLKDGLSIGAKLDQWSEKDGVIYVSAATIKEVSVVTEPAFSEARIALVASATEPEQEKEILMAETNPVAETEVSVEAAEVKAAAPAPVTHVFTAPRVNTNVTAGQYAMAQIKASQGDADSRDLVAALQVATVAENTGMVPPNYLKDVIGIIDSQRPFIDSIERAPLPASGMKIFTPKLGAQATVALTAEGAEFSSTDTAVTFQEDTIVKFAGAGTLDVELIDRSDPSFLDLYLRELAASYAQKTDAYASNIAAQNSAASTGSTIYKAIADGIADSYGIMKRTPRNLLVSNGGGSGDIDFSGLLGAVDSTGRPLFAAAAPMNANGLVSQGSTVGTVAGLNLVVDPYYTGNDAGVKYGLVYPTDAMRFHESGTLEIRANVVANGQIQIGIYGYVCVVNRYPTAFRYLTVA